MYEICFVLDPNVIMVGKPYVTVWSPSQDNIVKAPSSKVKYIV